MVRLTTFYVWIVFRLSDRSRRGYFSYVHFELRMLSEVELFFTSIECKKVYKQQSGKNCELKISKRGFQLKPSNPSWITT